MARFERGLCPRHAKRFRGSETAESASRRRAYRRRENSEGGRSPPPRPMSAVLTELGIAFGRVAFV
ncbi:MAG: hypothetical protein ACE5FK_05290, partial [Candidatus Methylomirabilia bacterium]